MTLQRQLGGWAVRIAMVCALGCGGNGSEATDEDPSGNGGNGNGSQGNSGGSQGNNTGDKPGSNNGDKPGSNNGDKPGTDGGTDADPSNPCGIKSGYPGDEYCILPPPPDKGFQLHIGPSDYNNIDPKYILEPGEESTDDFAAVSGNDKKIFFYYREYRSRPGAHHMIASDEGGAGVGVSGQGRRIGTSNNPSEDSPKDGIIAPENQGVGIPLEAHSKLKVNLHSINVTDQRILREAWVNFWYRDPADVTEPAEELFSIGSASFAIQPGEDTVLGPYNCTVQNPGRMLWFYGHRHANNVRFSAWRVRGGQRDLFYEAYNWEEVLLLDYSSNITNPVADRENQVEGGWTGILDLQKGDKLEWECHVINNTPGVLRFTNETFTGEMCIMDGEMVGTNCR
jgi:hypothetical protein